MRAQLSITCWNHPLENATSTRWHHNNQLFGKTPHFHILLLSLLYPTLPFTWSLFFPPSIWSLRTLAYPGLSVKNGDCKHCIRHLIFPDEYETKLWNQLHAVRSFWVPTTDTKIKHHQNWWRSKCWNKNLMKGRNRIDFHLIFINDEGNGTGVWALSFSKCNVTKNTYWAWIVSAHYQNIDERWLFANTEPRRKISWLSTQGPPRPRKEPWIRSWAP